MNQRTMLISLREAVFIAALESCHCTCIKAQPALHAYEHAHMNGNYPQATYSHCV